VKLYNWVDLRDWGGRNVSIGWVAPMWHQKFLPQSHISLLTMWCKRQWKSQKSAEYSPARTGAMRKAFPTAEYKQSTKQEEAMKLLQDMRRANLGYQKPHHTGLRRNWYKIPLQVYNELSTHKCQQQHSHRTVVFNSLFPPTTSLNIAISIITTNHSLL